MKIEIKSKLKGYKNIYNTIMTSKKYEKIDYLEDKKSTYKYSEEISMYKVNAEKFKRTINYLAAQDIETYHIIGTEKNITIIAYGNDGTETYQTVLESPEESGNNCEMIESLRVQFTKQFLDNFPMKQMKNVPIYLCGEDKEKTESGIKEWPVIFYLNKDNWMVQAPVQISYILENDSSYITRLALEKYKHLISPETMKEIQKLETVMNL